MATFNEKTGEIELTQEDREIMRGGTKLDVNTIMNVIIWGNTEGIINLEKKNEKRD